MLSKNPEGRLRPMLGKLLVGGTAFAALALTVSTLPDEIVFAAEPVADAAPDAAEKRVERVVIVHGDGDAASAAAPAEGTKREIRHVFIQEHSEGDGKPRVMMFDGKALELPDGDEIARSVRKAMPFFGLDEKELRAALAEQGIEGAKADAVIKRLEEKRSEAMHKQFSWSEGHAKLAETHAKHATAIALAPCPPGTGNRVMIDRNSDAGAKARVRMVGCGGGEIAKEKQVEAMKKARDRMAAQKDEHGMSAEIRASVVAELDKAIAELEAEKR